MGDVAGARADLEEAARLRDALGLAQDVDEQWAEPDVAMSAGDLGAAAEGCRVALARLPDGDQMNRNYMLCFYARLLVDLGLDEEARASAEDALGRYRSKEHEVGARGAETLLSAMPAPQVKPGTTAP
jgi:hypothetical protein